VAALGACRGERAGARAFPIPGDEGPRITVEVLNTTTRTGLAKAASRQLRRAGVDVVGFGNAPDAVGTLDSTRIVVRRLPAAVGERIRETLGFGRVVVELDSTQLVDASVLLGADFAPRVAFYP
jgi:calcineurin-like phosphoesterase